MVTVNEVVDRGRKATELAQELDAAAGVQLDHGELLVVERRGLLEDALWHGQLADVVEQAADRQRAETTGCQSELLADLNRPQRHTARVLLGRLVLVREQLRQRVHARTEERLLFGDEVTGAEVADERARLRGPEEVDRDGCTDDDDAEQLEQVARATSRDPCSSSSAPAEAPRSARRCR